MKIKHGRAATLALVVALAVAAPLSGCAAGDSDEPDQVQTTERDTGQDPADDDAAEEKDGDADSEELPGWVTENFPIFPDSEISTVSDMGSAGRSTVLVGLMTKGEGQEIIDWYNQQYSQDGWTIGHTQNEGARFNAEHSDGYMAVVGVTTTSTMSVVTLTASKPVA